MGMSLRPCKEGKEGKDSSTGGSRLFRRVGGGQGLTLVHFSAQRKRFAWDRGCA
jgi:hypothetical protein